MSNFSNFNIDFDTYKADIAEIKQQEKPNKEYKEVTDGVYQCDLVNLELGTNKAGDKLMLKGSFRIQDGEFANQRLWLNKCICGTKNDSFAIKSTVDFLNTMGSAQTVAYEGDFDDFEKQVQIVFADVQNCTFEVKKHTNDKGYSNLYIQDVWDN